ncbi:cell division cycle 123 protein [Tupanvirus deep ocean]|uniref:Cell division cycle 123 protein n=2 Tax=Tupanvirus TaxID=2094720 RepID=A0AC62A8M8_9VIRU|nr:cell division cycle 123 protein [Tupanvirus deep ocean]QKU34132.1 cell division cycle 123 protein [Tupanvirus deep ocean]
MEHIIVERVRSDNNNDDNNSNNHPKDPNDLEITNLDYETELNKTNLMNYAHLINYPIEWTYTFSEDDINIILKCSESCIKTGSIKLFQEELDPVIKNLQNYWPFNNKAYFFRFNSCSPKDGAPDFPVINATDVITKIVTSKRAWQSMFWKKEVTMYFVEYDYNWDTSREFRVFIYKRKVTAISQYNIMIKSILAGKSNTVAKNLAKTIQNYLENGILDLICTSVGTNNVVCDIYVNDDMTCKIIEFNSFGYWLAAGSALFHWLDDKKKLYNVDGKIYIRFVK